MNKPLDFAKLFQDDELGQILVVLDKSETMEGAWSVTFNFVPEDFGVCSLCANFLSDEEDGAYQVARKFFDKIQHEDAAKAVRISMKQVEKAKSQQPQPTKH